MWFLLAVALATEPADTEEPKTSTDKDVELIPGIQNAGLPPMAPSQLPPPAVPATVEPLSDAGLPPMVDAIPMATSSLPEAPPPLPVHEGLPPPPPPIEEAGLPPMAEPLEVVDED